MLPTSIDLPTLLATVDHLGHLGHIGHEHAAHGLGAGLLHPLLGLDHLLAMVAVGLIAAQRPARTRPLMPLTFLLAMALGFTLATAQVTLPLPTEATILASVILLGLAAALTRALHPAALVALVAVSSLAHGHAHGAEALAPLLPYALGMLLTTSLLLAAGHLLARALITSGRELALRLGALALAAAGGVLAFFA